MHRLLKDLNPAQQAAVEHEEGPLLVLAGPGSGKTRVVTHRIARIIDRGVSPSEILALTFTNKAADEMKRRVTALVPGSDVWVSTFHRFGARLLRQYADLVGLSPNFTIYDASDARQMVRRVIELKQIRVGHYTPDRIAAAISSAKNKLISADVYKARVGSPLSQVVADVYPAYQAQLLTNSAVDFDDLLLHVALLLQNNPEVRADLDRRFRYMLVDEYQDTNRVQYMMLRALNADHPNVTATGDPDQSIYGWRGADIANILQFEADFRHARIVRLEQNYRSTPNILQVADALIAHNVRRKKKSLFTDRPPGAQVRLVQFATHETEARGIAADILAQLAEGDRKASDFAVFYRINALSRTLEQAFRRAGLPYQMVRGVEFYQRKEIKDVLGYLQLLNNPRDDSAFLRVVNTPPRGIGRKSLEALSSFAYCQGKTLLEAVQRCDAIPGLAPRARKTLAQFAQLFDRLVLRVAGDLEEILGAVIEETRFREYLAEAESEDDLNRLANIEELLTDARQFDELHPGGGQLELYLENAWLAGETDNWDNQAEKVTLMTLHAAKGLEFPVVYLVAVEQGLLPHERASNDNDQLEEERRLLFVGLTRARDRLQLSCAVHRDFRGQRRLSVPSSFLMELPRDAMEFCQENQAGWGADAAHQEWEIEPWEVDDSSENDWESPVEANDPGEPLSSPPTDVLAAVTTAAQIAPNDEADPSPAMPRVAPDRFTQGMTVVHPVHGPGKIVALSGAGKNRQATVRFATAGERRFVLQYCDLQPVAARR